MSQKLKVVTVGSGSSHTPGLLEDSTKRYHELPASELWLVDVDGGREKLDIISSFCQRMTNKAGVPMKLFKTLDCHEALKDVDLITTQLHVGQLRVRKKDERIPLGHGYLGQETGGASGLLRGLHTIPVIFDVIKDVEELCPNTWVIDFTNSAGVMTEVICRHTNFKKFIGVYNIFVSIEVFINDILALNESDGLSTNLFGLSHMVPVKDMLVNDTLRFDELLDGVASG